MSDSFETRLHRTGSILSRVDNPFDNEAPWTKYEIFKAVILGPTLFPVRLVVGLSAQLLQAFFARIATYGAPLQNDRGCYYHMHAFGPWRQMMVTPFVITNRMFLWSLGFWHIRVEDKRRDKSQLSKILVVAPHQNLLDPFIVAAAFPPWVSGVAKSDLLQLPLICHTGIAGQGVFVDRKNPESRNACKDAIARRADPAWQGFPMIIFPEGTTTNGKVLIQFKLGPFSPGQPIQPVLLRYHFSHFDFSWVGKNGGMASALMRMMLQFSNHCTVVILDQYVPSAVEAADPMLFANNVRAQMAKELDVPTTEHSYDDVWFATDAVGGNVNQDFELGQIKQLYNLDLDELKVILKRFKEFDSDGNGTLSMAEFERAMGISKDRSQASVEYFFRFFDTDGTGHISYREFVQGLAMFSGRCSAESQAKLAFLIYDVDGTGRVRVDRLRTALDNAVAHAGESSPCSAPSSTLLASAALGGAKDLSFDEFCPLIKGQPGIIEAAINTSKMRLGVSLEEAAAEAAQLKAQKNEKKKDT